MTDWLATIDACWPAARYERHGPWTLRVTRGAGGRVSSISGGGPEAIDMAEAAARAAGQRPSFIIFPEDAALDAALAERGYAIADAVTIRTAPVAPLAASPLPHATAFSVWPPLQIMRDIWAEGGIGAERQAVMARAATPGAILARSDDRAAGVAFVAAHDKTALLSAVEVLARHRRKGVSGNILRAAAHWAAERGCDRLALVVARANLPANAAYAFHGTEIAAGYHYRRRPEE